jgi:hypothetical protein
MITRKITNTKQVKVVIPKTGTYYNANTGDSFGSIEELIQDSIELSNGNSYAIEISKKNLCFMVEQLPYCCGICEIGELGANKDIHIPDLTKFLDLIINQEKGITYMINTNGKADSIIFEKALAKCKNWICVKSFKNASSNNIISMWVSKNE